jgi:hypothetical protein
VKTNLLNRCSDDEFLVWDLSKKEEDVGDATTSTRRVPMRHSGH